MRYGDALNCWLTLVDLPSNKGEYQSMYFANIYFTVYSLLPEVNFDTMQDDFFKQYNTVINTNSWIFWLLKQSKKRLRHYLLLNAKSNEPSNLMETNGWPTCQTEKGRMLMLFYFSRWLFHDNCFLMVPLNKYLFSE